MVDDDTDRLIAGTLPPSPLAGGFDLLGRWRLPEPLSDAGPTLPPFPLAALPPWLGTYAASVSAVVQTPPALAGLLALTCLAVATAKRARVHVEGGWSEPLNLYAVCAMAASERKSPVFTKMTAPIRRHQSSAAAELAPRVARAALDRRIVEGRLSAAEKLAIAGKTSKTRADALTEAKHLTDELAALPVVVPPRLLADDVTPERLTGLLGEQGGRMAILSSEGDIFATISGRYSGGVGNFGVFLKGYSDPMIAEDRISRAGCAVPWPALTMGLTVQPSIVAEIAANSRMKSRGLLGRFLWALPPSRVGFREVREVAPAIEGGEAYAANMARLLALPPDPGADDEQNWRLIGMTAEARALLIEFRRQIEPRLAPYADLSDMAEWAGKLAGNAARIMGLLHLAERAELPEPWATPISGETAAAALQIARWSIPHAEAALTPRQIQHADADHVLGWLLDQPADILTQSQINRGARRRGWTVRDHLLPALQVLADRHWIRRYRAPKSSGRGRGRPSVRWQINPLARASAEAK